MKISIIIPVFNGEKYIQNCIESVLSQTCFKYEIIVVNDGSTDLTLSKLSKYKNDISIIDTENEGVSAARNKGLLFATGEYVYFLDVDDVIMPNLVNDNIDIINRFNSDLVIFGYAEICKNSCKVFEFENIVEFSDNIKFSNYFLEIDEKVNTNSIWNKLYKKSFLMQNKIKFSQLKIGEDALFNYEVFKNANRITLNKGVYYCYNVNEMSAMTSFNDERVFDRLFVLDQKIDLLRSWNIKNFNYNKNKIEIIMTEVKLFIKSKKNISVYSAKRIKKILKSINFSEISSFKLKLKYLFLIGYCDISLSISLFWKGI